MKLGHDGTTAEHRRYDPFNMSLLAGTYFLSLLRDRFSVRVINAADQRVLQRAAGLYDPRFVLLSTTLLFDAADPESIPNAVREIRACWPEATVALGGLLLVSYSRNMPPPAFAELLLRYGADAYVVSPRAEMALIELLTRGSNARDRPGARDPQHIRRGQRPGPGTKW